jgi:hypothetical protein
MSDRHTVEPEKYKESGAGKDFCITDRGLMGHHYEPVTVRFDGDGIFLKSKKSRFSTL